MKKFQRIGAIAVIVLLLSLYLICFIAAVSGSESLQPLFKVTLGMTIALPVLLYIFILFLRMAAKNKVDVTALPPEKKEDDTENGGETSE